MKRILAIVSAIIISISTSAQDIARFEQLCLSANENMKDNRFEDALRDYEAAMAIIQNENRPDLAANIDTDLIDFVIFGIAKHDLEKAKQYALTALGTRMDCLVFYANEGFFESKEDYVDNIANEAINIGYTLAGIGFLEDAESCLLSAVQVYPQTKVFTPNYILAQEIMCDFFTKYRENPGKGLEWEYEAFRSSVSLYEYDSEETIETFDHIPSPTAQDLQNGSLVFPYIHTTRLSVSLTPGQRLGMRFLRRTKGPLLQSLSRTLQLT